MTRIAGRSALFICLFGLIEVAHGDSFRPLYKGGDATDPPIAFSVEEDAYNSDSGFLTKDGDALISGAGVAIEGGRYEQLLKAFLADPEAEGRDLGLDAFDAISIEDGVLTRAFFSTEKSFEVTNPNHPLFGATLSHGDLLTKSGIAFPNFFFLNAFDLRRGGKPVDDPGLDAIDVQGISPADYDEWTFSFHTAFNGMIPPPADVAEGAKLFFSIEAVNDDFVTGPSADPSLGEGVLVSADDLLAWSFETGVAGVLRSGADGIPQGSPNLLGGFFPNPNTAKRVGLDAVDLPNFKSESSEEGETGAVSSFDSKILFSTSLNDDPKVSLLFHHGDLLSQQTPLEGTATINLVEQTNGEILGVTSGKDLGLDAIDVLGTTNIRTRPRRQARPLILLPNNLNTPQFDGTVQIPIYAPTGFEVWSRVEFQFEYSVILFSDPGVIPGPNFELEAKSSTKGLFTELSPRFTLVRKDFAEPGEKIADITLDLFNFSGTTGGPIEFTTFVIDDKWEVADSIPTPRLRSTSLPSKPVFAVPRSILSTSIEPSWIHNPEVEEVTAYRVSVISGTSEVVSTTVDASS
ncbi:MAG: hypothetical protein KC931_16605, partial [Candidatus Omnitrophica bacterium]|nr:hypothetical protein [Candidatus Omnitrophota bacterium]